MEWLRSLYRRFFGAPEETAPVWHVDRDGRVRTHYRQIEFRARR